MSVARSQEVVQFLSKAAEHLFDGQLDAETKNQRVKLIQEMTNLASKSGEPDDREAIRFKYAMHKLDALLKSKILHSITISAETEELFAAEIEQFHEVVRLRKKYSLIAIELPKGLSEESGTQLISALIEMTLVNRSNSIHDLSILELDFQFGNCERSSTQIPILVADFFGKLGSDVNYLFPF
jgi:hypothetical protein